MQSRYVFSYAFFLFLNDLLRTLANTTFGNAKASGLWTHEFTTVKNRKLWPASGLALSRNCMYRVWPKKWILWIWTFKFLAFYDVLLRYLRVVDGKKFNHSWLWYAFFKSWFFIVVQHFTRCTVAGACKLLKQVKQHLRFFNPFNLQLIRPWRGYFTVIQICICRTVLPFIVTEFLLVQMSVIICKK